MPVSAWSTTAASNGSTLGIDIAENCDAANINNAIREAMAQLKTKLDAMDALIAAGNLGATLTALEAVTTTANSLIYATASDTFATTTLSTFARTLIDDGDAATARTTLGALGLTSATFGANTIDLRFTLSNGDTLVIKGGSGTLAGNTTATVSFGVTFSAATFATVNGGSSNISNEGDIHITGVATTTGIGIANSAPSTDPYTWVAIGKLA